MATYEPGDAVTGSDDGRTRVALRVTPAAAETAVPSGFDEWRGRFEARVAAPARDGAANDALVAALSDLLDAPVRLASGHTAREKAVETTATRADVLAALESALDRA